MFNSVSGYQNLTSVQAPSITSLSGRSRGDDLEGINSKTPKFGDRAVENITSESKLSDIYRFSDINNSASLSGKQKLDFKQNSERLNHHITQIQEVIKASMKSIDIFVTQFVAETEQTLGKPLETITSAAGVLKQPGNKINLTSASEKLNPLGITYDSSEINDLFGRLSIDTTSELSEEKALIQAARDEMETLSIDLIELINQFQESLFTILKYINAELQTTNPIYLKSDAEILSNLPTFETDSNRSCDFEQSVYRSLSEISGIIMAIHTVLMHFCPGYNNKTGMYLNLNSGEKAYESMSNIFKKMNSQLIQIRLDIQY